LELTILRNLKESVAATATIIVIVSFWGTIGSVAQSFLFDQFYLQGVPYSNQDDPYWCGPASMSMVLGYWGTNISQGDIAAEIYDPGSRITLMTDMVSYPMTFGFKSQDFAGSIHDLKTWVDNGVPVVVLQRFSLEDPYGHYRVVVGYNDSSAMIFTFDPKKGINFTISYPEFAQLWQPGSTFWTTNWTLAITPENDVLTNLMKQHQINMNLERSDYDELTKEIEKLRIELKQTRDEATFYLNLFATTAIILIVIIISLGVYVATRKPHMNAPNIDIQADGGHQINIFMLV
jgi:hypothetical protein